MGLREYQIKNRIQPLNQDQKAWVQVKDDLDFAKLNHLLSVYYFWWWISSSFKHVVENFPNQSLEKMMKK